MQEASLKKLPNAPLQEVIFELLWEIGVDSLGNPFDSDFEFAQGLFAKEILKEFPVKKRTIPEGLPIKIYPKPIHQFWKQEEILPVVQLGQGILAINDSEKNYTWESSFFPLIKNSLKILEGSYDKELTYKSCGLRYIDAVAITTEEKNDLLGFVNSKFHINLSSQFEQPGDLSRLNYAQTFDLDKETQISLILNDGFNRLGNPAIIWQTFITTSQQKKHEEIISWVE
ncbi:MAG: TIGR04255 family protein, partial [Bacteroidota bacterium]